MKSEELEKLKEKLRSYDEKDIIITSHAEKQAFVREVKMEDVKRDIKNPERLVFARQQEAKNLGEEKYDCYFAYSRHLYNRYVLTINGKLIIVTIIKINRDWQRAIG